MIYSAKGYRSVKANSAGEAAGIFADREARKRFGKRGYAHHVRLDSWTGDGSLHTYQAFVGVPEKGGGMSGNNIWIHVYTEQ